ncbi:hypothetical protein [Thermosynechococcus sp.]|uniref:hypothetical protein n=1 Tax=Thermosynechococcus sp. TaxID=2814275 RepID=UPI00391B29FE
MKILEQTDYQLRLRERPWLIWFVGGMFIFLPILMLISFPAVVEIYCQRQTLPYECVATTSSLGIQQNRIKIPLSLLQQAKLEDYLDREGDRLYRVLLEVEGNSIRLGSSSSNPSDRAVMVQQINEFLAHPNQTELSVRVDDRWLIGVGGGGFFLIGILIIAFTPVFTLHLDRGGGTLTIVRRNFFRRTRKELRLREIRDIAIESSVSSDGDRLYRVVAHLTSGETVPLQLYSSSGYDSKKELANLLRQFLSLPPL